MRLPVDEFFAERLRTLLGVRSEFLPEKAAGALVVSVLGVGQWFFRAERAGVQVGQGKPDDCVLELSLREPDFDALIAEPAERWASVALSDSFLVRPFALDAERVKTIREQRGTLLFVLTGTEERKLWFTPGSQAPELEAPRCQLDCSEQDFSRLQNGEANPMELFMNGRIRAIGDLELPMVLASVVF